MFANSVAFQFSFIIDFHDYSTVQKVNKMTEYSAKKAILGAPFINFYQS